MIDQASLVEPTSHLEGTVVAFYGDFREPSAPLAVLNRQLAFIHENSCDLNIVFQKTYAQALPIDAPSPTALVPGLNQARFNIMEMLEQDIQQNRLE